jgi:hypothetical protein
MLAVTPEVVFSLNVVPLGGFTRPIVISKVDVALNPEIEKPEALWFDVLCEKEVAVGAETL